MTTLGFVFFWIVFALFVILSVLVHLDDLDLGKGFLVFMTILRSIGIFVVQVLAFLVLYVVSLSDREPDQTTKQEIEIYSMGINSGERVNGSFVLGCGSVDGKTFPTYRYFTVEDNRYKLREVNANNFDIVCTDSISPRVIIDATKTKEKVIRLKWLFNQDKELIRDMNPDRYTGTIYIPVGSVIQSYNVQL